MNRLSWLLPPVVWMATILFGFSSDAFSGERTSGVLEPLLRWLLPSLPEARIDGLHVLIRKAAHLAVYGILAGLWLRAFVRARVLRPPAAVWVAFAMTVAWACVDEVHQTTVPSRGGSALDVALDALGAAVVLIVARGAWRRTGGGGGAVDGPPRPPPLRP